MFSALIKKKSEEFYPKMIKMEMSQSTGINFMISINNFDLDIYLNEYHFIKEVTLTTLAVVKIKYTINHDIVKTLYKWEIVNQTVDTECQPKVVRTTNVQG